MRIAYNLASRSRPEKFFACLDNIRAMSANKNYCVFAKLDKDDPAMDNDGVMTKLLLNYPEVIRLWGTSHSKVHAINRDLDNLPSFDILINMSDDMEFTVKGFDDIIRKHMPADLNGFLHFPDSYKKASACVLSIIGRTYFERTGYIYHPDYISLWADVEETEKAKLLGKCHYIPESIFEHNHYSNGKASKDQLYLRNNTWKRDLKTYQRRRANNFDLPFPKTPFLLIKYASRGRWREFFEAIDNIHATIRTNQFKIIVSADLDDVELNCGETREFIRRYPNVEIHYGEPVSKMAAINRDIDPAMQWDWLVNTSDDMKFMVPGWDYLMLESIQKIWGNSLDFFAHFSDGYVKDKLPTMNICGRAYYDRFGYIYHPSYKSVSSDAENMFVAQMLGRYHYFPEVYFHHIHPANLRQPSDHIYRRNHIYGEADTQNYFKRMAEGFGVKDPVFIPDEVKQRMVV